MDIRDTTVVKLKQYIVCCPRMRNRGELRSVEWMPGREFKIKVL